MDRGILCRGKSANGKEWVEGYYLQGHNGDTYIAVVTDIPFADFDFVPVDPSTVGQYTGLTDKRGVKIFEGDICKDSMGFIFEVQWDNENARFLGRHEKPRGEVYICYVGRMPAVEVIGNIHDNPELLKGG